MSTLLVFAVGPMVLASDAPSSDGKTTGALVVRVFAPEGVPLPGATLFIGRDDQRPIERVTDEQGRVTVVLDCDSRYALRAVFPGFAATLVDEITICGAGSTELAVTFVAETCECVTIGPCGRDPVDLDKAHTSMVLRAEFLQDLPGVGAHAQPRSRRCRCREPRRGRT